MADSSPLQIAEISSSSVGSAFASCSVPAIGVVIVRNVCCKELPQLCAGFFDTVFSHAILLTPGIITSVIGASSATIVMSFLALQFELTDLLLFRKKCNLGLLPIFC